MRLERDAPTGDSIGRFFGVNLILASLNIFWTILDNEFQLRINIQQLKWEAT